MPSHIKVRRQSFAAGKCEAVFWKRTDRQEVKSILLAARKFELSTREPGERNGALGHIALEILDLFTNLVDFKSGRLDPSLETLMRMLRRSKDAITRALKALRQHGFLNWIRRYVPTGEQGRGPQIRQTSNAYRLRLPAFAGRLISKYIQPRSEPDDLALARLLRTKESDSWMLDDSPLGKALARLRTRITERESAKRSVT